MNTFSGTYTASVEENGRISLPAALRRPLGEEAELHVIPARDGSCLEAAGEAYVASRRAILARMKPFDPRREALELLFFGEAASLPIDAKGRVTLPQKLRDKAGINGEIVMVGMGDRFRLWDPAREAARRAAILTADLDFSDLESPEGFA